MRLPCWPLPLASVLVGLWGDVLGELFDLSVMAPPSHCRLNVGAGAACKPFIHLMLKPTNGTAFKVDGLGEAAFCYSAINRGTAKTGLCLNLWSLENFHSLSLQ